jgi:transposase
MEVLHPRCAGLDISKQDVKVCVRIVPEGQVRPVVEITTRGATSGQILELGQYLLGKQVTCVVMEATGDYWKPFYYLLGEVGLDVTLVNARSVKQIPGRKTDVADALWLADLGAHGLVRGSFVPDAPVRELKDLVRARTTLVRLRGQQAQRLEKLLESAAIKLSSTISDILGVSGRAMLQAMIDGENDPGVLAGLADRRIKAGHDELAEALTGRFSQHHAFLARVHLDTIDAHSVQITKLEARISAYFDPDATTGPATRVPSETRTDLNIKRDLLSQIPGIDKTTAEQILAEIGPDLSAFPTAKHLVSWAGVAPGANQSAGRVKSTKCRPGNTYLKGALGVAALTNTRVKTSFFHARYKRVLIRRGHAKALVAVEHAILTAIWHVLTTGEAYQDLGADYYTRRKPGTAIRNAVNQLKAAGLNVTFTEPTTAVIT